MVGQYGTHVDPPAHFAENGITMDQIPLKQMILPLVVLDDTPYLGKDPNHAFSVADLKAWERAHGRVPKGAFAALRTDMYKDWDTNPERFKRQPFPAWAFETIKYLYEQRGVTATGHEAMDTDTTDKMDSETYILQHGHYQIEVMANLDKVPATGAVDRGDVAEGGKRPWLSGARVCDLAVRCCYAPRGAGSGSRRRSRARPPIGQSRSAPAAGRRARRGGR